MTKSEKALLRSLSKRQVWTPVPYAANQKEIDGLVTQGEIVYDPRCEAAMLADLWDRAPDRVQRNQDGWEALQRAENPPPVTTGLLAPLVE
jgi:hypothetical protein